MENEIATQVMCPACGSATRPWALVNTFPIRECTACRMKFVHPLPADVSKVYSADYFFGAEKGFGYVNYDQDKQAQMPALRTYLNYIEERRPERGRLLDVGAATGVFVELAQKNGWQAEGIEISAAAVASAQAKHLPVREALLEDVSGESLYDAITFLDVLEHLPQPKEALRMSHRLLRAGGVLLINVPNAGSWYARLMGKRWHAVVPPEHLSYFTFQALERLLKDTGFTNIKSATVNKSFGLPYLLATVGRWLGWTWFVKFSTSIEYSWLGKIKLPIPLGDNLMVRAEKA